MSVSPKALVLGGKTGLLGKVLADVLQSAGWEVAVSPPSSELDLSSSTAYDSLSALFDSTEPDVVFNTIAYTQVDAAEDNPEKAACLNTALPATVARLALSRQCRLVHYSTDFVFDGKSSEPYKTSDKTGPVSVYGKTKLAGEEAIISLDLPKYSIIRTAWLFGPGRKNFVSTIMNLCKNRNQINVVYDQKGSPTYTVDLAQYTVALVATNANGVFHLVNSGIASWCDFAAEAVRLGGVNCAVQPIPSSEYPQKALRPAYSVLDNESFTRATGITPRPWVQALRDYIYREFPTE